jgi:hypothetical protein
MVDAWVVGDDEGEWRWVKIMAPASAAAVTAEEEARENKLPRFGKHSQADLRNERLKAYVQAREKARPLLVSTGL